MWICRQCGQLHDDPEALCCGERVVPLEEAFSFQQQLFELEGNDRAQSVFQSLRTRYSEACAAVSKAMRKVHELESDRDAAGEVLTDFYRLTCEGAASEQDVEDAGAEL